MQVSRRKLIQSGAALTLASWSRISTAATVSVAAPHSSFDPWIEIHRENLLHNVGQVQRRVGSRPILGVVKNNAYGMGLVEAGRLLSPVPAVSGFAVVKLQEAVTLRDSGVRKPILLMGACSEPELEEAFAAEITPIVYTPIGATLESIAQRRQQPVPIHIFIDTGLGREGIPYHQAAALCRHLASRKAVRIEGIMSAFNEVNDFEKEQFRRFQALCTSLKAEGIHLGKKHLASTTALFRHPESFLDMVRPGAAIYGVYNWLEQRDSQLMDLRTAVSLKAKVIYVKQLRKGDSAGYEAAYVAKNRVWVATLPFGRVDGLPPEAPKGARVRIRNDSYPVVALSTSHTIVEIGPEPRVQIGDTAVLFDGQAGSQPEDLEIACGVPSARFLYALNPLLPRLIV